ncbi:hypothetical protein TSMEX_009489 [Taenia solium]|eukprot:TsM_000425800 transcript=TsM_000425800 gene=TsM_000425800
MDAVNFGMEGRQYFVAEFPNAVRDLPRERNDPHLFHVAHVLPSFAHVLTKLLLMVCTPVSYS